MCFIGLAAIIGIGVDFYSKRISPFEAKVHFKIDINKATKEELMKLNGIGPVLSVRIIKYRSGYGLFREIEDIKRVYGISEEKFDQIKDYLIVN